MARKKVTRLCPDGEEITIETVTDYVLPTYDRHTDSFQETAVLTAVEKDFGEGFIDPAKQFAMLSLKSTTDIKIPELMDNEECTKSIQLR